MDEAPVKAGDVLGHKYRVDRVLGVGGMGVVVAATHLHLDQKVALKFMLATAFKDPDSLARFQREARAAVRLKSEHVARVLDTGTFENNSPYIVMEYLEGHDLSTELARMGALPLPLAAEFILHACDAIAEAHALGIVHRDLKPANIFLTLRQDGTPLVKVLDFGISKSNAVNDAGLGVTSTQAMMGSPLYMSPEQMKSSKNVDARSDVWSLGIILYELLSGQVPFQAETLGDLLAQVMMDVHRPLSAVRPDVPRDVSDLIDRCLAKDRNQRAQSVAEIARALGPHVPARALPLVERIATVIGTPAAPHGGASAVNASTQLLQRSAPATPQPVGPPAMMQAPRQPSSPQLYGPQTPQPVMHGSAPALQAPAGVQTSPGWGGTAGNGRAPRSSAVPWIVVGVLVASLALGAGAWKARAMLQPAGSESVVTERPASSVPIAVVAPAGQRPEEGEPVVAPAAASTAPAETPPASSAASATPRPAVAPVAPRVAPRAVASAAAKPASPSPAVPAVVAPPPSTPAKPGMLDTSN